MNSISFSYDFEFLTGGEACLISAAGSVWGIGSDIGGSIRYARFLSDQFDFIIDYLANKYFELSIRMPAFFNGIFGHKPSRFMAPIDGLYPGGSEKIRFVTTGPLCRYVEDILPMLKIMSGPENSKIMNLDSPVDFQHLKLKVYR